MIFFNKLFSTGIVFCLCALVSTQQVHTKNKPNLSPLVDASCTEVSTDTEADRNKSLERISCEESYKRACCELDNKLEKFRDIIRKRHPLAGMRWEDLLAENIVTTGEAELNRRKKSAQWSDEKLVFVTEKIQRMSEAIDRKPVVEEVVDLEVPADTENKG